MQDNKQIVILGGGTNSYITNHFAVSAPAYGQTAIQLAEMFREHVDNKMDVNLILTKMADPHNPAAPDTPEDIEIIIDQLITDPSTRVIVFNVAMVDFKPNSMTEWRKEDKTLGEDSNIFGKYHKRLSTSGTPVLDIEFKPYNKIIQKIRKERKDILLVGFKTTCGSTKEEQFNKGLKLCKDASANIVFVNDVDEKRITSLRLGLQSIGLIEEALAKFDSVEKIQNDFLTVSRLTSQLEELKKSISINQNNGLVTPEESSYWYNTRHDALKGLVQMVLDRSHLHFTRSTVVDSETIPWFLGYEQEVGTIFNKGVPYAQVKGKKQSIPNPIIPETFRAVFDWVRSQGAYKQGPTGATVGHFGIKLGPNEFLTSKRKTDFNKIEQVGLVRVITDDPDNVFGYKHFFENKEVRTLQNNLKLIKERSKQDQTDNDKMWSEVWTEHYTDKLAATKQNVIAFGAKPSVGGQSQRSLFDTFPDLDCIVHFHCPLKTEYRDEFTPTPQFSFECGSYECIKSNITGFKEYKVSDTHSIWAGHMDYHGPNIVFNKSISPQLVINFINKYWDLSRKTDGLSPNNK